MANKHSIAIAVLADTKPFAKSMRNLANETGLSKVGAGIKRVGAAIAKGMAVAGAAVTAAGIKFGQWASNLQQSEGGVESVFKKSASTIKKWASSASQDVGLTANAYNEMATILGSQLKNMGIDMDQVTGKTGDLIKLGSDLAATFGGPTSDAVSAISALMRGEADPIERYGVSIKQADVNARLAEKGLKGLTGAAAKQAHALTVLELLNEQTADAQGQFAREANTAAGATERLKARLIDKATAIGTYLLPAYTKVVTWINSHVEPAFELLTTFIETKVKPAIATLSQWFTDNQETLAALGAKLQEIAQTVLAGFIAALQAVYAALQTTAVWIKNNHDWLVPLVAMIASAVASYQAYIKVMAVWKAATAAAKAAQIALNVAMTANPIGLIIAAIGALVAALVVFFTKTETGKRLWDRIWSGIKSTFQGAMRAIQPVLKELQAYWNVMWPRMKALWDAVGPPLINYIKRLFSIMASSVGTVFKNMGVVIKTIWNQIKNVIKTALGVIQGIIKTVTSVMKGDWKGAWDGIKQIVKSMTDGMRNTFKNLASGMGEIGKNIIRGLVGGLKSLASAPGEALTAIGSGIKNKFKSILGIHSPSKVFEGFGANIVQGLVGGLDKNRERASAAITKIANKIKDAKHLQGKSALVEYVRAQGRELDALWKSHDQTVKKLTKAKDQLKALLDARRSMRDQIASSLTGAVNLGSVVAKNEDGQILKGKTTKKDVAGYVSGLAKKAKTFAARMKDLVKAGWPESLVQHIAGLGWDEGVEVAKALLAKGKGSTAANKAIKADWASIEKSSLSVGRTVANDMFNVGVDAAQGLVDGLKASAKKTEQAAKDLAKTLAKWVKKELGIKSPSRLFRTFGRFTTEGLALGLTDEASRVAKSMKQVTHLVTDGYNPALSPTLPNGAQSRSAGSVTYQITVNALTATEEVGRKVVESIKKFERAGGRV